MGVMMEIFDVVKQGRCGEQLAMLGHAGKPGSCVPHRLPKCQNVGDIVSSLRHLLSTEDRQGAQQNIWRRRFRHQASSCFVRKPLC